MSCSAKRLRLKKRWTDKKAFIQMKMDENGPQKGF
jgi:hypothetical protein